MTKIDLTREDYATIGKQLRARLLQNYDPDSCIETTAATVDLLKGLGVESYPLTVVVAVMNEPLWRASQKLERFPAVGAVDYPPDGYGVGVGMYSSVVPKGKWGGGHLVTIAERKWLLDFSIDQANRPQHGIELGQLVLPIDERFLRGDYDGQDGLGKIYRHGNVWLAYTTKLADKTFKDTPAWTVHRPQINLVGRPKEKRFGKRA